MQDFFITKAVTVTRENSLLKIEGEESLKKVPISLIRGVYLFGSVELTRSARNLLLKNSKNIYLFDHKAEFVGMIISDVLKSNYKNRLNQYKQRENIEIAKFIVLKKIETIEQYTKRSMQRYKEKLFACNDLQELLGIEGSASVYMFEKIKNELEGSEFEFVRREYRPVKDKINGLFSFVYSLFYSFLEAVVVDSGFDPYIGFLHKKRGSHMAFVSDVMEGYRVALSAFVVQLIKQKLITQEDFKDLYLSYEGRRKFLKYYVAFVEEVDHRWFIDELSDKISKEKYSPF